MTFILMTMNSLCSILDKIIYQEIMESFCKQAAWCQKSVPMNETYFFFVTDAANY